MSTTLSTTEPTTRSTSWRTVDIVVAAVIAFVVSRSGARRVEAVSKWTRASHFATGDSRAIAARVFQVVAVARVAAQVERFTAWCAACPARWHPSQPLARDRHASIAATASRGQSIRRRWCGR